MLIKDPGDKPFSEEQLGALAAESYRDLTKLEKSLIDLIKQALSQPSDNQWNNDQWQVVIGLQSELLGYHYCFFRESQHPCASQCLRQLATENDMVGRMWRYGIFEVLELLYGRRPASIEHMLTSIYMAYSQLTDMYVTVPAFRQIWTECLGDLARWRMALEPEGDDRGVWTAVSRDWYSKASDEEPTTGRLCHNLAILSSPILQSLFYCTKSLCVPRRFDDTRIHIRALFDPVMKANPRPPPTEFSFVRCHGILFRRNLLFLDKYETSADEFLDKYEALADEFISSLDNFIGRQASSFKQTG